jgi:ribosomal protein L31E
MAMEREAKALLEKAKHYALLSKRAARAASRARSSAERQMLKERARLFLEISKDYFERAQSLCK